MDTPTDFVHLFQDRNFLQATFNNKYYSVVGIDGAIGRRYAFGPLCIEYYTTDKEPELSSFKGLRLIIWNPVTRTDDVPYWKKIPFETHLMVYAYIDIRDRETYWRKWSKTFVWNCNQWEKQELFEIKIVSYEVFSAYYLLHGTPKGGVYSVLKRVKRHTFFQKDTTHFYVLQHKQSQEIVAGISVVDSDTVGQSYYIAAFTNKDMAPPQAGLWLLKHWMDISSERGIRYANFGTVWTKGQPKSWKGFSAFKAKFNPKHLVLPREHYRFTFSFRAK